MKVQTKIILLVSAIVVIFVSGIIVARRSQNAKFERIAQARTTERAKSFDAFLQHYGEPLAVLVKDSTYWDGMVRALHTQDQDWIVANLGDPALATYGANVVWIYRTDLAPFYAHNNLYADNLQEISLPKTAIPRIFAATKFPHFFLQTPQGLMEVRGATIHPSQDSARVTPPQGYFFAGRLWSNQAVRDMALFTGNEVQVLAAAQGAPKLPAKSDYGTLAFLRELPDYDGKPLAYLFVKNTSSAVAELDRFTNVLIIGMIAFAFVMLGIVMAAIVHWVSRPLRCISDTLNRGNTAPLLKLQNDRSEFGKLAQLIRHFFEQRSVLMNEMSERRQTEEALKQSEEQLRQAQKMEAIGQLAGGVAHDFNNLLTAIIGYSSLLVEKLAGDRVACKAADSVRKAGEQAAGLTRQLLAFSRKQILQPRVIDLNSLVLNMESLLRRVIGEHIDLRTIEDAHDARVKADPSQIEQIILNLAVNARDAMPSGGVLTIRTATVFLDEESSRVQAGLPKGDYVVLAVTDTGEGMDKETQRRIFEPFFTTKGPGKGTGLGLATVYGVVKQSGGGISLESAPGRGTSFRIYLPLERAALYQPKMPTVHVEPTKHAETLLVVEDEEIVRKLVCDVLKKQGYAVLCAERGSEALRMCDEHRGPIHLLITDVIMPEQSGPEVARRIIARRPETHVLYISGYSDVEIGTALNTDLEILPKPFTPAQLAQRVQEVLRQEAHQLACAVSHE